MITAIDADVRFDGRPGRGSIRARGGRLVVEPDGWRSALGLGLWAWRRGTVRSGLRRWSSRLGRPIHLKLPGLPPVRIASPGPSQSRGKSSSM